MTIPFMRWRDVFLLLVLACAIALAAGCSTSNNRKVEQPVDDFAIQKSIGAKIATDPELIKLNIRVASRQGEVTLSGTVPVREIKTRLIKLALSVHGVKSVKDDLTMKK